MKINIKEINGNEIINYLNSLTDDDMDDIAIVLGSFVFEAQRFYDDRYELYFTGSYNNWGTDQEINDNTLHITEDKLWFSLEEPFDGSGSEDVLEEKLTEWLETHTFADQSELFYNKLGDVYQRLPELSFSDIKLMDEIIETLTELKSYMKE